MSSSPEFDHIVLESEQEQLFERLVEAWRSSPRAERRNFLFLLHSGGAQVQGNGFLEMVLDSDIHTLDHSGLIEITNYSSSGSGFSFFIPPSALAYYEHLKSRTGGPIAQVELEIRSYLDADRFRNVYPIAFGRWSDAAELLWRADSESELSTIGHKCREAVQEFATELLAKHQIDDANPDPTKTRDRLSAVLSAQHAQIGKRHRAVLDALFVYWLAAADLIQRQEHAAQKEGEALNWEDGRRVVFQTALVMFEIDRSL